MRSEAQRIDPQSGTAFELRAGSLLRIIDLEGEQVADLTAFSLDGKRWLSSGRSIDYNNTVKLTTGNVLYSNRSEQMLKIEADTVGEHDFLLAPCSPEMFVTTYV